MITLTQLEYIVALDTYRHFSKAAEKSQVTQPTLSMQIRKLEDELGVVLFDRSRQPVITTEAGKIVVEQARIVLREAARIREMVKNFEERIHGELSIGIIPTLAPYLIPLFAGDLYKKYPEFRLHIRELQTEGIIQGLKKDELDCGILSTPLNDEYIREERLFYEEIKVYTSSSCPLYKKDIISVSDLNTSDMWMLTEGNCFRNQVVNLCDLKNGRAGRDHFHFESASLETLKKMVDMEGGFTLLPELAVLDLSSRKLNRVKPFTDPKPMREISLVYVRTASKRRLLEILREHITSSLPFEMLGKRGGNMVEWH